MKNLKRYYELPAAPEDVYAALTNPFTLGLWTGEEATMPAEVGGEFSLWGGSIVGKNLAFDPGKSLTQQWYFGEDDHEPSIVTFILHPKGKGTSVEVRQTNIPDEAREDIQSGWNDVYFAQLTAFFRWAEEE